MSRTLRQRTDCHYGSRYRRCFFCCNFITPSHATGTHIHLYAFIIRIRIYIYIYMNYYLVLRVRRRHAVVPPALYLIFFFGPRGTMDCRTNALGTLILRPTQFHKKLFSFIFRVDRFIFFLFFFFVSFRPFYTDSRIFRTILLASTFIQYSNIHVFCIYIYTHSE